MAKDNDAGFWGCFGGILVLVLLSLAWTGVQWLSDNHPAVLAGLIFGPIVGIIIWAKVSESTRATSPPPATPDPAPPERVRPLAGSPVPLQAPVTFEVAEFHLTPAAPALEPEIQFVDSSETLENTRCLVCRIPLAEGVILCWRCQTPHHRECFRYLGECAVYACGCRRYRHLAPRSGTRPNSRRRTASCPCRA